MSDIPIEEVFGLTAIVEWGGKVRLYTDDEMIPWICQEINVGVSLGRPEAEIKINIVSKWGERGLRLYPKARELAWLG